MEFKVLIADDEAPVREWLEFCVNESGLPCRIIGLAANGGKALEIFHKENPDIIITDIRMPVLNGIEFAKKAKQLKDSTQIIILTCHDDFEYARDALKYGVDEYILKTEVSKPRLYELLKKSMGRINQGNIKNKVIEEGVLIRSMFFKKILEEEKNCNITELEMQSHNIFLKDKPILAIAIKFYSEINIQEVQHQLYNYLNNITYFPYSNKIFLLIGNIELMPSVQKQIERVNSLASSINGNAECTIGISKIYNSIKQLSMAVKESLLLLNQEFYNGPGSINIAMISPASFKFGDEQERFSNLKKIIHEENLTESFKAINSYLGYASSIKMSDIDMLKDRCQVIINMMYYRFADGYVNSDILVKFNKLVVSCTSFTMLQDIFNRYECILKARFGKRDKEYSVHIAKAIRYIEENFRSIEGLIEVANAVCLNPEYFSRLFGEETGCNFNEYLTKVRMKEAMWLLKTTSMKVHEISQAVGYNNAGYFSVVFKKHYGQNPLDYRNIEKGKKNYKKIKII